MFGNPDELQRELDSRRNELKQLQILSDWRGRKLEEQTKEIEKLDRQIYDLKDELEEAKTKIAQLEQTR